jgi:hypothetical protein
MECTIDSEDFMDLVAARIQVYWKQDTKNDIFFKKLCDYIDEYGNRGESVMYIADNFVVNGDYGDYCEYRRANDTDESFHKWLENNAWWWDDDEEVCIIHFGI